jgi:hypothetical protein
MYQYNKKKQVVSLQSGVFVPKGLVKVAWHEMPGNPVMRESVP